MEEVSSTCPARHPGPDLPPTARLLPGGQAALCDVCRVVSQVCRRPECGGRTRAGGLRCRLCGHLLPRGWRERFWEDLAPRLTLAEPVAGRRFRRQPSARAAPVALVASDAWLAAALGCKVLLLEPGPALPDILERSLRADEALIGLRAFAGDDQEPEGRELPEWRLLTTQRTLRLDLRGPHGGAWIDEPFPEDRAELLWELNGLYAHYRAGQGSSLFVGASPEPILETAEILTEPAWLTAHDFVCSDHSALYSGTTAARGAIARFEAPERLGAHAPVFDAETGRVYVAGETAVHWWQPENPRFVSFVPAGAGALLRSPLGVVILEGDRLRIITHEEHVLWDSRLKMPDFTLAALPWDHAGNALLVPTAVRGAGVHLLLADLKTPGRLWNVHFDGALACEPKLVPGGIVAARRMEEDALELLWIEVAAGGGPEG